MEYSYNDYRNLLIYQTLQHFSPGYLRKRLPDYLNEDLSYLDIVDSLRISKSGATIFNSKNTAIKLFFAETQITGTKIYSENLINEKMAIIELCIKVSLQLPNPNRLWVPETVLKVRSNSQNLKVVKPKTDPR